LNWDYAGFGDGGHKVGVADPAGHGVKVEMAGDSCAGGLAEVDTEIEALGVVELVEDGFGALGEFD